MLYTGLSYNKFLTSSLSILITFILSTLSLYLEVEAPDSLLSFLFVILIILILVTFVTFFTFTLLLFKVTLIGIFEIFPKRNLVIS